MEPHTLIEAAQRLLWIVLAVSFPVVAATVVVGLLTGVLQAVTQIQDASIGFFAKLVTVATTLALLAPWGAAELTGFGRAMFDSIVHIGRR